MLDVVDFGLDTLRVAYQLRCPLPMFDDAWLKEMEGRGFVVRIKRGRRRGSRLRQDQVWLEYQDPERPTLRLFIYNPRQIVAEFSLPRLKSGSVLNLELVGVEEAKLWVVWVGKLINALVPEGCDATLEQFKVVDMAVDIKTGEFVPEVVAALSSAHLAGCRGSEKIVYRRGGVLIRGASRSLSIYPKGVELEKKLKRKERKVFADVIAQAKSDGRLRIEHRFRPQGGASADYLDVAARELLATLEGSFQTASAVVVGGVRQLIRTVDALPLTQHQKDGLIAYVLRGHEFGDDYLRELVSVRQLQRVRAIARQHSVTLFTGSKEILEIDLSPILEVLQAA